jgi:hypothetical protein
MFRLARIIPACLFGLFFCLFALAADFEWDWGNQQELTSYSPKLALGSGLSEADRTALIDAIAMQLKPPMAKEGYSDERIHDVASTTRYKLIDLNGDGKPEVFASPNTLEAGCDPKSICPLWILRRTPKGSYAFLLDVPAHTFTVQPTNTGGYADIVIQVHGSGFESELTVYRYAMGKYVPSGCYTATWAEMDGERVKKFDSPRVEPCNSQ